MMRFSFHAVLALLAQGCPPSPTPPGPDASDAAPPPAPPPDASDSIYARACANLAMRGCSEGLPANCAATLEHGQTARIIEIDAQCLATKTTKAELRACSPTHSIVCP